MKERVKQLCKEKGVSMNAAESEMGLAKGYISKLDNSNPNQKTLQKMSDYFGVSVEFLISGKEDSREQKITSLSQTEELDIMKDVDVIIDKLKKSEEVVLRFNGEKANDEGIEYDNPGMTKLQIARLTGYNEQLIGLKKI